jgi:hypothetical protein
LTSPPRFADLDNVLLAPHSIAWTDELFRDIGRAACQGMIDLQRVFERPTFQAKWKRIRG